MIRHVSAGWRNFTIGVQVTPFEWHLGVSVFKEPCRKFAFGIGPLAVAFYWKNVKFRSEYVR